MASTFFGLTIASSGLSAFQASVNATTNNISNSATKGYSRQEAIKQASEALRVNAKYGTTGSGVEVTAISQIRDIYYDMKYWSNNSKLGEFQTKSYYMEQVETYFQDDKSVTGFTTIFGEMFDSLDQVKSDATSLPKRNTYISDSLTLANYFKSVSTQLTDTQEDINEVIGTKIANINSIAQKVASLNKQINIIEQQGSKANELRDQRALLVDELSKIMPVEEKETKVINSNFPDMESGATNYTLKINGQVLVSTFEYNTLKCVPRNENRKVNQSDADGLYDVYWNETNVALDMNAGGMTGELKALYELRDGNNAENFNGKFTEASKYIKKTGGVGTRVTITGANIVDPSQITMPSKGTIAIGNKEYVYEDYRLIEETDAAGKKTYTYEFDLAEEMPDGSIAKAIGKEAEIGDKIDCMGVPYYQAQMNEFIRNFTKIYNDMILKDGVNLNGDQTGVFFVAQDHVNGGELDYNGNQPVETVDPVTKAVKKVYGTNYYYTNMESSNISVAEEVIKDPSKMAASTKEAFINGKDSGDLAELLLKTKSDITVFRGGVADDFLQCLLSDISVDTQKSKIFEKNYTNLAASITNQRMSVSGVDKDEEALLLVKYQNAYNLSSKVIQVMSEMYDRLITQTGV